MKANLKFAVSLASMLLSSISQEKLVVDGKAVEQIGAMTVSSADLELQTHAHIYISEEGYFCVAEICAEFDSKQCYVTTADSMNEALALFTKIIHLAKDEIEEWDSKTFFGISANDNISRRFESHLH